MTRRKRFLIALWTVFGLFWVFMALGSAIKPVLEPSHGPPIILILQIALAVLCALVVVRVMRNPNA